MMSWTSLLPDPNGNHPTLLTSSDRTESNALPALCKPFLLVNLKQTRVRFCRRRRLYRIECPQVVVPIPRSWKCELWIKWFFVSHPPNPHLSKQSFVRLEPNLKQTHALFLSSASIFCVGKLIEIYDRCSFLLPIKRQFSNIPKSKCVVVRPVGCYFWCSVHKSVSIP